MSGAEHEEVRAPSAASPAAPAAPARMRASPSAATLLQLQRTAGNAAVNRLLRDRATPRPTPAQALPEPLRRSIEHLSNQAMDDVVVHRDSAEPGRIGAHAYAEGDAIHLAPGAEQHLPHEAWHVAQQRAGRVRRTTSRFGRAVNDSPALEREADRMGARAATHRPDDAPAPVVRTTRSTPVVQGVWLDAPDVAWASGMDVVTMFADLIATKPEIAAAMPDHVAILEGLRVATSENREARGEVADYLESMLRLPDERTTLGMLRSLVGLARSGFEPIAYVQLRLGFLGPADDNPLLEYEPVLTSLAPSLGNDELRARVLRVLRPADLDLPLSQLLPLIARMASDDELPAIDHGEDDGAPRDGETVTFDNFNDLLEIRELPKADIGLRAVFDGLAESEGLATSDRAYDAWYAAPVLTRAGFRALFGPPPAAAAAAPVSRKVIARKRTPGSISFQAGYATSGLGPFTNVSYQLDKPGGNIDFARPKSKGTWTNPVQAGSKVQLRTGAKGGKGLMQSGKVVPIAGGRRSEHFSMANRIRGIAGSASPAGLTWHHLSSHFEMVLVDRVVHQKHGHNGGVLLW